MGGEAGKRCEDETCERGGGPSVDTPERDRLTAPLSTFEDSPVFNYIVNLSPLDIAKPIPLSQTLNPLNLASPPPIFTSPHVSSLKGCTLLRRYNFSDPSLPENSSENKAGNSEVIDIPQNSNQQHITYGPTMFMAEDTVKQLCESSSPAIDVSRFLNDSGGSPICSATPSNGHESVSVTRLAGTSMLAVSEVSARNSEGSSTHVERLTNIVQNNEATGCDWENLISDASDLLIFASPNDAEAISFPSQKPQDYDGKFCSHLLEFKPGEQNYLQKKQYPLQPKHHKSDPSGQAGEECSIASECENEDLVNGTSLKKFVAEVPCQQNNNELVSRLNRGMKRRCLVFETAGSRIKHLDDSTSSASSVIAQPDNKIEHSDKHPVLMKPGNDSSRHTFPGIGLHLNALSRNSKDLDMPHDTMATAKPLVDEPSSSASLRPLTTDQGPLKKCTRVPCESGVLEADEASLATGYAFSDSNQISPLKKHKLEITGGSEGCKRCNCKKSKCLKLYCDCFAAGLYCVDPCSCQDCLNKPIHEDTVLATRKQIESRNPLAFAPKVIRSSDSVPEIGDDSSTTPASARHKRGCNCKKSGCLKKYCECYQSAVGCSINCRCEGCRNAFGRKEGYASLGAEREVETEDHKHPSNKCVADRNSKYYIQTSEEQKLDSTFSASPLQSSSMSVHMPFSVLRKPLQPSSLSIGSCTAYHGGQRFGKENEIQPLQKGETLIQTVDGIHRILQGNCSPVNGIKSASPNSKRVSPPHFDGDSSSPTCRRTSSRKLILQSIPSFPSLTTKD